jgi:hypothetical protein
VQFELYLGLRDTAGAEAALAAVGGYTPDQIRGAYGVDGVVRNGTDDSGVRVAIVDAYASPTIQHDIHRYSIRHDLPPLDLQQMTRSPEFGEHAAAEAGRRRRPSTSMPSTTSRPERDPVLGCCELLRSRPARGGSRHRGPYRADIITNSFGGRDEQDPISHVEAWHDIFLQAGAEGIGTFFSSGDDGDGIENLGFRTVQLSASDPTTTAVGGTSLGVDAVDRYVFETGWGTGISALARDAWRPTPPGDFLYGGGGGTSRIFAVVRWGHGARRQRGRSPSRIRQSGAVFARGQQRVPRRRRSADPDWRGSYRLRQRRQQG